MTTSKKPRTFLATTALDEFWDKTQPILFLGEWCKPYKTKHIWENLDSETLDSPLIDQNPDEVLNYVYKIYRILLSEVARWLNQVHGVNHSLEYWEIIIGSFLFTHVQTVYDRYSRLKKAYSLYPALTTIGLDEASYFPPLNTMEYYDLVVHNDGLNLQIISQLISAAFISPIIYKSYSWSAEKKQREKKIKEVSYKIKTRAQLYFLWVFVKLRGSKIVALIENNFTKKDFWRLMWSSRFRVIPLAARSCAVAEFSELLKVAPDFSLRSGILNLPSIDEFSKLALKLLAVNMPMSFIENYKNECVISKKRYPYFVKVALGFPAIGDDGLKFWMAKNYHRGSKRVEVQHGGGYGALKSLSAEFWEYEYADFYISWGTQSKNNVIAAPVIPIARLITSSNQNEKFLCKNNEILWVASEFSRYPFPEIKHSVGANHYEKLYYNWQSRILASLDPAIFSTITMRLRHTDWSDNWRYVHDEFPNLKLYKPTNRMSFYEHILTAKLLLFDNLNTTYIYGLSMNIPSILFWDEEIWTIRDDVRFYFDALRDVGIYHATVESAANMINKVGQDPSLWWNSKEVQAARKQFCDYFAYAPKNWLEEWKDILLKFL